MSGTEHQPRSADVACVCLCLAQVILGAAHRDVTKHACPGLMILPRRQKLFLVGSRTPSHVGG